MASPSGLPSMPISQSKTRSLSIPQPSAHRQTTPRDQPQHNQASILDTPLSSSPPHTPSQPFTGLRTARQFPPTLLLDGTELLLNSNTQPAVEQHKTKLLQTLSTVRPSTSVPRNQPTSSLLGPWNSHDVVTTSMSSTSSPSNLQPPKNRPYSDSGYDSTQGPRSYLSTDPTLQIPFETGPQYPNNDPLGSATQQKHILPDQLYQQPSLAGQSTIPPASIAAESVRTRSKPNSSCCEFCKDTFNTMSDMTKHMARHTKKHTCDVVTCHRAQEGFATKNDLDRHKGTVHGDESVVRGKYKCSVPGCKDPQKLWGRKDNFKAHVRRMHPDQYADFVVEQSLLKDEGLQDSCAAGLTGGYGVDYGFQAMFTTSQNPSHYYHASLVAGNQSNFYETRQPTEIGQGSYIDEGDMYEGSGSAMQQYHTALAFPDNLLSPARRSPYDSSHTMPGQNNLQDNATTPVSHKDTTSSFLHDQFNLNDERPFDIQTLPAQPYTRDEFMSPLADWSYPAADNTPVLGAASETSLGIGSWSNSSLKPMTQEADILDTRTCPNLATATNDESASTGGVDNRKAALEQEVNAMIKNLPEEYLKILKDLYQRHPSTDNKDACHVKSAMEAAREPEKRPFKCKQDGCSKTFTQGNILRKHQKRHFRLFFCTLDDCYSTFGSKDDLRRHEFRRHHQHRFEGWRCFDGDVPASLHKIPCTKFFANEDDFKQHRRDPDAHHERAEKNNGTLKALKPCRVLQGEPGPFWCGFCAKVIQNEPNGVDGTVRDKFRYDHIDNHITKDEKRMKDWVDLKSNGLTKLQVKAQSVSQLESEVEDEADQLSPQVSATVGITRSQIPTLSTQGLDAPSRQARCRKRAASPTGPSVQNSGKIARRSELHQSARQAPEMSRGGSNLTVPGQSSSGTELSQSPRPQATYVVCCQCHTRRNIYGTSLCGSGGCFHPRCRNCATWDENGNVISPKSTMRNGPGGGG